MRAKRNTKTKTKCKDQAYEEMLQRHKVGQRKRQGKKQISSKPDSNCGSQCDKSSGIDGMSLTIMEMRKKRMSTIFVR